MLMCEMEKNLSRSASESEWKSKLIPPSPQITRDATSKVQSNAILSNAHQTVMPQRFPELKRKKIT